MFFRSSRLYVFLLLISSEYLYAQNYAARVVDRKSNASDSGPINPNANAAAEPKKGGIFTAPPEEPQQPATGGFVEEDLTGSASGTKRSINNIPPAPPPLDEHSREMEQRPVTPAGRSSSGLPPEAWDPRGKQSSSSQTSDTGRDHAGDNEDGGIGISGGIGFGSKSLSASLGLTFPIYRWLAWNLAGSYYTAAKDQQKETKYGPEASLMIKIPSRVPITPFAGIGVGYDMWSRYKNDVRFDNSASLLSLYYAGISIPMAKHLEFNVSQTWKTYLGRPPRTFEDFSKYESYGQKVLSVGIAVVF